MEYSKLIIGVALIIIYGWFLNKHTKRYGFAKALLSIDVMLGLIAGLYLIIASIYAFAS